MPATLGLAAGTADPASALLGPSTNNPVTARAVAPTGTASQRRLCTDICHLRQAPRRRGARSTPERATHRTGGWLRRPRRLRDLRVNITAKPVRCARHRTG